MPPNLPWDSMWSWKADQFPVQLWTLRLKRSFLVVHPLSTMSFMLEPLEINRQAAALHFKIITIVSYF